MKNLTKEEILKINKRNNHDLDIVVVLENIQYAKNVAGIFRTLEATGITKVYLVGNTTTPPFGKDLRKASRSKEDIVDWKYVKTIESAVEELKKEEYYIVGLEITDEAKDIRDFKLEDQKIAIVVGNEVSGLSRFALERLDTSVYIPMYGKGSSLNVATSLAIMLYNIVLNN